MARGYKGEREEDGPGASRDSPFQREEVGCEHDHHAERKETDGQRQPKSFQDSRDLDEEVGLFDFLFCRTPRDVIREEMGEQRLGQMD